MSGLITARWTPRQADFDRFAALSGDDNPIHVDAAFSARTTFGRTVAHGMLLYTRVWALVASARPGARHLAQSLMFPSPAYADEELEITIAVKGDASCTFPSPLLGEGRKGGDATPSLLDVAPTDSPSLQGGGGLWCRSGKATLHGLRVARVRDGAEVLIGECTIKECD